MRRIIAAGSAVLLLVGCAHKDPFEDLADGACTSALAGVVNNHISGQIDALADKDWDLAYSFASDNFQSGVSIENFTFIINEQYPMLIENKGYEFNECNVADSTITQEVDVTSGEQVFSLTYSLTVNDSTLGVESAVITKVASQVAV
ncbi:MAG: DUF4864 domain-containing protein [Actinobacteria bacterium]|nr:DUF4864 domain-containing protein [Actinomycetota bacterium]